MRRSDIVVRVNLMGEPRAEGESAIERLVSARGRARAEGPRSSVVVIAFLLMALLPVLLVAGCWAAMNINHGHIADADILRPLPPNVVVLEETAGCPGNGDGWQICQRRIRFTQTGGNGDDLYRSVLDHYKSAAVPVRAVSSAGSCNADSTFINGTDAEKDRYLCVYVEQPDLPGTVVDVVAESFVNVT